MSVEIALIAGSSVAGAVSAAFLEKLGRPKSIENHRNRQLQRPSATSIRGELVSLLFEKTLASEAITRVYEAAQQARIDRLERDRLLMKYKQQLDSLNHRIQQLQPVADYVEVAEMRNTLSDLLQERITALDRKLEELAKSKGSFEVEIDSRTQQIIKEITRVEPATKAIDTRQKSDEKTIEQLQDEIVQALDKLEQVEIDKD
jgi:chromosome segregation ATPase